MGHAVAAPAVDAESSALRRRALEDRRLFSRYREDRDEAAREQLVERFLPLAIRLARRYAWGPEADDLAQVACVGLVKAIDRFDHDRGVAFTSYAVPTIVGELKRYLRDTSWAVHVPQSMQARVLEVSRAADALSGLFGRSATAEEVADAIGATPACVADAFQAASAHDAVSLDWSPNGDSDERVERAEALAFEDDGYELVENGATLGPALDALPPRERLILHLRFDLELTQSEIAARLGMSQMHVSRLIRRTLTRLREYAGSALAA